MNFAADLAVIVARECAATRGDDVRMGDMIERLAASLGMSVAVACRGDGVAVDQMLVGVEAHIHSEAVDKSRIIKMMLPASDRAAP